MEATDAILSWYFQQFIQGEEHVEESIDDRSTCCCHHVGLRS
jgi:hypothetical protein